MFTNLFGGAPHARVFDYLAEERSVDHTITGIARGADVARPTVYKVLDDFREEEVVVQTRTVGNSRFFKINRANPTVQDLLDVFDTEHFDEEEFPEFDLGTPSGVRRSTPGSGKRRPR